MDSRHQSTRLFPTSTVLTTLCSYWQVQCTKELADLKKESSRLKTAHVARLDTLAQSLSHLEHRLLLSKSPKNSTTVMAADVVSLEREVRGLSLSANTIAVEQRILKSLSFPTRPIRHETIRDAHKKTFGWIFQQPNGSAGPSALCNWLKTGQGIFWVSGKPGSGKSTFSMF